MIYIEIETIARKRGENLEQKTIKVTIVTCSQEEADKVTEALSRGMDHLSIWQNADEEQESAKYIILMSAQGFPGV